jgi:hypothetical protein
MILRSANQVISGSVLWSLGQEPRKTNRNRLVSPGLFPQRAVGPSGYRCGQGVRRPGTNVFEGDDHQTSPDSGAPEREKRERGSLCDFSLASPNRFLQNAADDPWVGIQRSDFSPTIAIDF